MRGANIIVSIVTVVIAVASVGLGQTKPPATSPMSFQLTSSAFGRGSSIPGQYTCDGADASPELSWGDTPADGNAPQGTVTFALVMNDPDAPVGDWVHWVVWNIPATSHGVVASFPREEQLRNGTRQGRNDFGKIAYNGPCPPPGKTHRYFFRVYAVDARLDLAPGATRAQIESALKGHILAQAEYMGTYRR